MYALGDDSNIENLISYLTSAKEFENALITYDRPIIQNRGGILGICEKHYTLRCPFDLNLFNLLDRLQKLDLYEYAQEFIHKNAGSAKRIIRLLEQAVRLRTDPSTLLLFFNHLKSEVERTTVITKITVPARNAVTTLAAIMANPRRRRVPGYAIPVKITEAVPTKPPISQKAERRVNKSHSK